MDFLPIHLNEHVNSYNEVATLLAEHFAIGRRRFFPLRVPIANLNLCVGFRLAPRAAGSSREGAAAPAPRRAT